jgi:hypothetical protein
MADSIHGDTCVTGLTQSRASLRQMTDFSGRWELGEFAALSINQPLAAQGASGSDWHVSCNMGSCCCKDAAQSDPP